MTAAAKPKRPRAELDAYYTPDWPILRFVLAVHEELELLLRDPAARLLEPCAGDGAIIRVVESLVAGADRKNWVANDINFRAVARLREQGIYTAHGDALAFKLDLGVHDAHIAVAITNPKYLANFPLKLARHLMTQPRPPAFFAMLCRITLLETPARAKFFREFPPHVYVLPERVSYTGDGQSDNAGAAWFVFRPGQTDSRLFWLTDDHVQPGLPLDGE